MLGSALYYSWKVSAPAPVGGGRSKKVTKINQKHTIFKNYFCIQNALKLA